MANFFRINPKWRNFTKSGHTGSNCYLLRPDSSIDESWSHRERRVLAEVAVVALSGLLLFFVVVEHVFIADRLDV